MSLNRKKIEVCSLSDLQANHSLGWNGVVDGVERQCFLVYRQGRIYSYLNHCPHTGINLNWMPDQFLDNSGELIQCSMHGALFTVEDGLCLHGPCLGERLQTIENTLEDDLVYLVFG